MEEPLFDILRTKEQLGYDVYCTVNNTNGILGYSIVVNCQAGKFTTEHADLRITTFVKNLAKTIRKMSDREVNEIKENLKKVKQVADVHLKDEVSRNWAEIVQQNFMFDRIPKEIDAIQKIKTNEVKKWLDLYSVAEKETKKLSIQVVGYAKDNKEASEMSNHILPEKPGIVIIIFTIYTLHLCNLGNTMLFIPRDSPSVCLRNYKLLYRYNIFLIFYLII